MNRIMRVALATVALVAAGQASAQTYLAGDIKANDIAKPYMTYGTTAQITSSRTSGYSGVGTLFVSYKSTATNGGYGSICTGSLVGGGAVLTAAHCLSTDASDPVTGINFYLPSLGARRTGAGQTFFANSFAINPLYATTGLAGGNDVALFSIVGDASAYDSYGFYNGDPLTTYLEVGTGTIGGPNGTGFTGGAAAKTPTTVAADYNKRVGSNIYEYYGSDLFSDSTAGVVLYDTDDGTAAHDVFGFLGGNQQTGIANEASSSPGDSGGPEFINGKIVSVTSFGISGAYFTGTKTTPAFCGGTSVDPYNNAGTTAVTTDLRQCTNSSVGEIGGNTLVSYNMGFINAYLTTRAGATNLPEPATWATMMVGFGLVGAALRRGRRSGAALA